MDKSKLVYDMNITEIEPCYKTQLECEKNLLQRQKHEEATLKKYASFPCTYKSTCTVSTQSTTDDELPYPACPFPDTTPKVPHVSKEGTGSFLPDECSYDEYPQLEHHLTNTSSYVHSISTAPYPSAGSSQVSSLWSH